MPKVVIKTQSSTKLETNLKECQIDEKKNCKMFHKICYHYSPYYCLFVIISIISIYLVVSGVHERVGQGRVTEFAKYLRNFLGIFSKQDIDEYYPFYMNVCQLSSQLSRIFFKQDIDDYYYVI